MAALVIWSAWPSPESEADPAALSRADGKSRFYATKCYDYAKKRNFQDTLLLIRETPRLDKVVPRTKLAEYQKARLVKAASK